MGILKMSIIGTFIMLPFIFVGNYEVIQLECKQNIIDQVEENISEASYDAAFAIKAYSQESYDSENPYNINMPYREIIDIFFDSLAFRKSNVNKNDFWLIAFMETDSITYYNPSTDKFVGKFYYEEDNKYYTMYGKTTKITETGDVEIKYEVNDNLEHIILNNLEQSLNIMSKKYAPINLKFNLPEYANSFYSNAIDDVSFVAFYYNSNYFGLGKVEQISIKPSGVMKELKKIN